jgi:thioredoxin-dependent peroxiredoxin
MNEDFQNRPCPQFALLDQNGVSQTNENFLGSWLVVYFYPKDFTPGCTEQACSIKNEWAALEAIGNCKVVGISKDTPRSHKRFADFNHLPFALLSDPDAKVADSFGSLLPKSFMGKEYMGVNRDSFIINPEGIIVAEYRSVKPAEHMSWLLTTLAELQA